MRAQSLFLKSSVVLCAVALAAQSGCTQSTKACKAGTLFLTVQLDSASVAATTLEIDIVLGATTKHGSVAHTKGAPGGTIEADFPAGYPAGQTATVTVNALSGSTVLGSATKALTFSGACQSVTLSVKAPTTMADMAGTDLSVADLSGIIDGSTIDGAQPSDLATTPVDFSGGSCSASNCSGTCVDGVCCNSACTGQCEACNLPGKMGICSPVTGAPIDGRAPCTTNVATCAGTCDGIDVAACTYTTVSCSAATCNAGNTAVILPSQCQDGACVAPSPSTRTCNGTCSNGSCGQCTKDTDCGANKFCDNTGSCATQLTTGAAATCSNSHCIDPTHCGECASGNCVDGACCNTACAGLCNECTIAKRGTCNVQTGAPLASRGTCPNPICQQCNGADAEFCHDPVIEPTCTPATCNANGAAPAVLCQSGVCASPMPVSCTPYAGCSTTTPSQCATTCGSDTDCTTGNFCSSGHCIAQLPNGTACTTGSTDQCASTFCVANSTGGGSTCCNSACSGGGATGVKTCAVCDGTGGSAAGVCGPAHVNTQCNDDTNLSNPCTGFCNGTGTYCPLQDYCTGSSPACCGTLEEAPSKGMPQRSTCVVHVSPNPPTCP